MSAAASITTYLENTEDNVIIDVLPLAFDYGLYQVLMGFKVGATVVLERSFLYPAAIMETIARERVTGFPIVPTISAILLQLDLARFDFSSLRYITNTAAALPAEHVRRLRALFPSVAIYSMYGLTECKRVSYLPPDQLECRITSVGRAIPGTEVDIVDEHDRRVGPGVVGELVVRGSHVTRGYWGRPEEAAARFRPGPVPGERVLYTGDLFRMDEDGYLYFVARKDDIIKTRGEKVSPKEVEEVLYTLPEVAEAAVVGAGDPVLGEAIRAVITVRGGARLTAQDVLRHCLCVAARGGGQPGGRWGSLAGPRGRRPAHRDGGRARPPGSGGWAAVPGGTAADFAVERAARAFGPALALQQAVAGACESGEFAFLFGFPNRAAKAVFERAGYRLGRARRVARPLSSASYLRRWPALASAGRLLATPLDLAMRLVSRETYRLPGRGPELEPVEDFDESFDAFWMRRQPRHRVVADRDSQYLNWRYGTCPTRRYERAVLRRGRELIGTLVWYRIDDLAYVAEMLAADAASFDALLEAFLHAQRRAGAAAVSLIVLGDAPFAARLATYGFFPRPVERTMMVYVPSPSGLGLDRAERWCLFEGDIL